MKTAHPSSPAALPADVRTLADLFAWRCRTTPQAEAYRQADPVTGLWQRHTWSDMHERVAVWSAALRRLQLPRGARVAMLLPNGLDAVCLDQATLAQAGVPVPMHALDNPGSIAYVLSDSEAALLVVGTLAQWRAIAEAARLQGLALTELRRVVVVEPLPSDGTPAEAAPVASSSPPGVPVVPLVDWLTGRPHAHDGPGPEPGLGPVAPVQPGELAALVYTSGTTGRPKGVMLTHANVMANIAAALSVVTTTGDDVLLSFLPLSHTFERTAGYYLPIAAGACVAFARSVKQIPEDLLLVRPTVLVSVPRIYERVYVALQAALAGSPLRQGLFDWTVAVGWRRFRRRMGLPAEAAQGHGTLKMALGDVLWPLLDALVGRTLRARFGGRLRVAISGGAPLAPAIARCFLGLGIPIAQGYGMTETSPVVATNTPEDNDPATVGRLLPGVEVRLGESQELQVRGPNVMRGYWRREADTAGAFTADGWLRTGDQAAFDAQGRLRILGRIKEIIVTSTGEKIAPVDLELAIAADPLFEQVWAHGDNRPFIVCFVVLGAARWNELARTRGVDPAEPASLDAPAVRVALLERARALTAHLPHYAQPKAVVATLQPWTVENGLLTPTLKPKRRNLLAHFAADVERVYGGGRT